jgi:hypothetical protein
MIAGGWQKDLFLFFFSSLGSLFTVGRARPRGVGPGRAAGAGRFSTVRSLVGFVFFLFFYTNYTCAGRFLPFLPVFNIKSGSTYLT